MFKHSLVLKLYTYIYVPLIIHVYYINQYYNNMYLCNITGGKRIHLVYIIHICKYVIRFEICVIMYRYLTN